MFARDNDYRHYLETLQEPKSKLAARTLEEGIDQEDFPAIYKPFKKG